MRFLKRARPTDTKHLHKSRTNPGLNFPHVPAAGVYHMEQLLVIAAAAWFYLRLHLHKHKNNIKVSNI
jgi:organic hydroperoxide reductase OsmC/OhrA